MMRLFLCQTRGRTRSIVNLCEEFDYRRAAQKELIRTVFTSSRRALSRYPELTLGEGMR